MMKGITVGCNFKLWRTLWHELHCWRLFAAMCTVPYVAAPPSLWLDIQLRKKFQVYVHLFCIPAGHVICVFTVKYKHKTRKQSKHIPMFQNRASGLGSRKGLFWFSFLFLLVLLFSFLFHSLWLQGNRKCKSRSNLLDTEHRMFFLITSGPPSDLW